MVKKRLGKKWIMAIVCGAVVLAGGGAAAVVALNQQKVDDALPTSSTPTPSSSSTPEPTPTAAPPVEEPAVLPRSATARGTVPGWNLADRGVLAAVLPDAGGAYDGAVSLRIDAPVANAGTVAAKTPMTLLPSTEYTLTAAVRTLQPVLGESGVELVIGAQRFALPETNAEWQPVEFTFTTGVDESALNLDVVLGTTVRGFGIDGVAVVGPDGVNVVGNGSFEQVEAESGLVNDSLIFTTHTAALALNSDAGDVSWSATPATGGETVSGNSTVSGGLGAVPLDGVPQGYYDLSVTTPSGLQITTNIAVIDSTDFYLPQDSRFGVGAHVEGEAFAGTGYMAASLGFGEVRNDLTWARNETVKGQYDWDESYLREFPIMHANGVKLLALVAYGNTLYGSKLSPSTPEAVEAYGAYASAIASTFDVVGLEVFNEFNFRDNGVACGKTAACYFPLVESVSRHLDATNPDVSVVVGSTAFYEQQWFIDLWGLGALDHADAVSYHPYEAWINRTPDVVGPIAQQSYEDMRAATGTTKPVWMTELGYSTFTDGVTLTEQSIMAVRSEVSAFMNGVEKFFYYDLVNDKPDVTIGEGNFGLLDNLPRENVLAHAPKPAAFAQALTIAQLANKEFVEAESDDVSTVGLFGAGSDVVRVAWATGVDVTRSFPSDVPMTVTTLDGIVTTIEPIDGAVSVALSGSPVFINEVIVDEELEDGE